MLTLLFCLLGVDLALANSKPNILLFVLDDFSYVESMSESSPALPSGDSYLDFDLTWINTIRDEGFIFPNTYAAGAKPVPFLYSLLTGRYPSQSKFAQYRTNRGSTSYDPYNGTYVDAGTSKLNGSIDADYNLPNTLKTEGGYATGLVGRYSLQDNMEDFCGSPSVSDSDVGTLYASCVEKVKQYGFDFVDALYIDDIDTSKGYSHNPEWMVQQAIEFIDDANSNGDPFFLFFGSTLTRNPNAYDASTSYDTSLTPSGTLSSGDTPSASDVGMTDRTTLWNTVTGDMGFSGNRAQRVFGPVWADDQLGALYNHLDSLGSLDETMILVLNNQGTQQSNTLYESGVRVFQFVRYPSLVPSGGSNVLSNFVVSSIDVAPTLLELAGVDVSGSGYEIDGRSWLGPVASGDNSDFQYRVSELYQSRAIISLDGYKYIWRAQNEHTDVSSTYPFNGEIHELYDLTNDDLEQTSEYNNSQLSSTLTQLQDWMTDHVETTCPLTSGTCKYPTNDENHYLELNKLPTDSPSSRPTSSPIDFHNKPNIIVFHLDDFDLTSSMTESHPDDSYSYMDINTTWINKIRNEGFIFPLSYCGGPKCAPSRYSLLTGRYPSRAEAAITKVTAARSGSDPLNGTYIEVPTVKMDGNTDTYFNLPNILRTQAGYTTAHVGKWHLLDSQDTYCGDVAAQITVPDDLSDLETSYATCTAKVAEAGFDFVDGLYASNIDDTNGFYSHNPEWMVHVSQQFMSDAVDKNQSFFLYMAHTLTHTPDIYEAMFNYDISRSPKGYLTGDDLPDSAAIGMTSRQDIYDFADEQTTRDTQAKNMAAVLWADEALGALYKWLEARNILDKTVIVVLNDHGQPAKSTLYERGIRIMNFIRYPPIAGGKRLYSDFVVSNIDLAPTLFELAGLSISDLKSSGYKFDGHSWLNPVISNDNTNFQYRFSEMFQSRAVVTLDRMKYIWRATQVFDLDADYPYNTDWHQLYDLTTDSLEQVSLYNNSNYRRDLNTLQSLMSQHINATCPVTSDKCREPENPSNHYMVLFGTNMPTQEPLTPAPTPARRGATLSDIQQIDAILRHLIDTTAINGSSTSMPLLATTVRLAFHDCVGGCDGCINLDNPENNGLQYAIEALETAYQANWTRVISRADFWAICGTLAWRYGNEMSRIGTYDFSNITMYGGRDDCANTDSGPYYTDGTLWEFPNANGNTDDTLEFFEDEFGFDTLETVVILGAHTLGIGRRENSGFFGKWVDKRNHFDNDYFVDLIDEQLRWVQLDGNKQWIHENGTGGFDGLMLNADMSLWIDINASKAGSASCVFTKCPLAPLTNGYVSMLARNNTLFLKLFEKVWNKMITTLPEGSTAFLYQIDNDVPTPGPTQMPTVQPTGSQSGDGDEQKGDDFADAEWAGLGVIYWIIILVACVCLLFAIGVVVYCKCVRNKGPKVKRNKPRSLSQIPQVEFQQQQWHTSIQTVD